MKSVKQTIQIMLLGVFMILGVTLAAMPVSAADEACKDETVKCCGGVKTSLIACDQPGGDNPAPENTGLWGLLLLAINIMVAGVGVLALAGIVYGSVLYTSAGGNPEQVKKARTIFTNVVIGVLAFGGMYVFLNFLIPGGVFQL